MDKPSAEAAFSLKRTSDGAAVSGSFSWYGNALIFSPSAPLAAGTNYTASVGPAAKDIAGNLLVGGEDLAVHDLTQPLDRRCVAPADGATEVLPNGAVVAIFDRAMDKPSAQAAFSLKRTSDGAPVSGSFGWYGTALHLQAQRRPGARDAVHGERLDRRQGPRREPAGGREDLAVHDHEPADHQQRLSGRRRDRRRSRFA